MTGAPSSATCRPTRRPRRRRQPGRGAGPRKIDPYAHLIDAWLRRQPKLKASVIWERLVAEHGFQGHYQRVKVYVRDNRARLTATKPEPVGFHRRFEVLPGAQVQVDWGDEGQILTAAGPLHAFSFHMRLAYSRDPFCCFAASQGLGTFWDCHRRAFAHFGGVPAVLVYDRTKTVVRRHVGRGQLTPLHPEAVAFAGHYGFAIWLAAPYRAQTKGRVERQVEIVRSHVLDGREFAALAEMDAAFAAWLPIRRAQVNRTHGEVIGVRAERDRAALGPLPEQPYVVCDRHIRRVGKDALVSFAASYYLVPWRRVRPGCRVELPGQGGQLDLVGGVPGAAGADQLGLVQAVDRLGQRVVVAVASGADRADRAGLGEPLGVADAQVLPAAVGVVDQPVQAGIGAGPDGHLQGVQGQAGPQGAGDAPADDGAAVGVDDERGVAEPGPGGHIGPIRDPQAVGRRRTELAVDQVGGTLVGLGGGGGAPRLAAHDPADAQLAHEPGHPVAACLDAFPLQLPPDLAGAVHLEVLLVDPHDLHLEPLVSQGAG